MKCEDHQGPDERLYYGAWVERAERSKRAGERQRQCSECQCWYFPWEMKKP